MKHHRNTVSRIYYDIHVIHATETNRILELILYPDKELPKLTISDMPVEEVIRLGLSIMHTHHGLYRFEPEPYSAKNTAPIGRVITIDLTRISSRPSTQLWSYTLHNCGSCFRGKFYLPKNI